MKGPLEPMSTRARYVLDTDARQARETVSGMSGLARVPARAHLRPPQTPL